MSYQGTFEGVDIVVSDRLQQPAYQQFRFPKSKRKRIVKKWFKDTRNWRTQLVGPECIRIHATFYCTQRYFDQLMVYGVLVRGGS